MRKRMGIVTFFALALAAAAPAAAQAHVGGPVDLPAGKMAFDSQGNQIGAIESRAGTNVVLVPHGGPIALPATSFGKGEKGPILPVTRANLVAARAARWRANRRRRWADKRHAPCERVHLSRRHGWRRCNRTPSHDTPRRTGHPK